MRASRLDPVGLGLAVFAAVLVALSYGQRRAAAAWYDQVGFYNRTLTNYLVEHRDQLVGRQVAVFGATGLSPWLLTTGSYLSQLLGGQTKWLVFVPNADPLYRFGALPHSDISVHPESTACDMLQRTSAVILTFDEHGWGAIARNCEEALERIRIPAIVAGWGPKSVTAGEAEHGFDMYFTGTRLVPGVEVVIDGKALPMAYGEAGRLMTASVPPRSGHGGRIEFSIVSRDAPIESGSVEVR